MLDHIVDCSNVGVVQRRGALRFLEQAFAVRNRGTGIGRHALDGDKALQRRVFRAVDLPHTAGAEALGDDEATDGGASQRIRRSIRRRGWRGRLDLLCHGRSSPPESAILILVKEESQSESRGCFYQEGAEGESTSACAPGSRSA